MAVKWGSCEETVEWGMEVWISMAVVEVMAAGRLSLEIFRKEN